MTNEEVITDLKHFIVATITQATSDMATKDDINGLGNSLGTRIGLLESSVDERFGEVNKRFDVVDGRLDIVDRRLDEVDERFNEVDERFNDVNERFDAVDKQFDEVDERFNEVDERFNEVDERFDEILNAIGDDAAKQDACLKDHGMRLARLECKKA